VTDNLIELGVLSVTARNNTKLPKLLESIKAIMPEYWTPTNDVLCGAIIHLTQLGYLQTKDPNTSRETVNLTKNGRERLSTLFLLPSENVLVGRDQHLLETLQLYSLDLVADEIGSIALQRMVNRILDLRKQLSARAKSQKLNGNYADILFRVESLTLETRFKMLTKIAQTAQGSKKLTEINTGA
jgi:hypothetical protein